MSTQPSLRARQLDRVLASGESWHDRLRWTRDEIEVHQQRLLRRLLRHAIEHSPFHAARLREVDPSSFPLGRLSELPVMTKGEMMDDFDRVVTDRRLTRTTVEAHTVQAGPDLTYLLDEYVVMASGGSSGTRGVFVYDDEGFISYVLTLVRETLHTMRAFGITGEQPIVGAIVAAGSTMHATAAAARLAGVAPSPVRLHPVPATQPFDEIVQRLDELQPTALIAYGSVLTRLAMAKDDGRLTISPFVVGSTSEPFSPEMRVEVERAFGVPVGNTFGSTEGLVGLSTPGEDVIRFAEDTCIVELVDDSKVYVTNLTNLAQPLIRYELTDRFRKVTGDWPDGYLRAVVDGRSDAPLQWGAVSIHPLVMRSVLVRHADVVEHQIRQTVGGIDVDVVTTGASASSLEHVRDGLRDALAVAGLAAAAVAVRRVDQIGRDPASGKVRRIVPLT
jgi:phenylacetate-CoA ligase